LLELLVKGKACLPLDAVARCAHGPEVTIRS
jgi:hypothetical protein